MKGSAEITSSDHDHDRATQKRVVEFILDKGVSTDEGRISADTGLSVADCPLFPL